MNLMMSKHSIKPTTTCLNPTPAATSINSSKFVSSGSLNSGVTNNFVEKFSQLSTKVEASISLSSSPANSSQSSCNNSSSSSSCCSECSSNSIVNSNSEFTTKTTTTTTSNSTTKTTINDHLNETDYLKFSSYINRNLTERQMRDQFYSDYLLGSEIGKGGFGTIFSGIRQRDQLPVAIKVIKKSKVTQWYEFNQSAVHDQKSIYDEQQQNEMIINTTRIPLEIALMIRVRESDKCIKIYDYLEQKHCFIIIMERLERCKDLFDLITEFSHVNHVFYGLSGELAKDYFRQIVEAVLEIRRMGILHRDLKDENILIDLNTNQIKLIDFGAGRFCFMDQESHEFDYDDSDELLTDFHGTRVYSPPEWILNKAYYGNRATVWSLGVLLFNMIYGDIPWEEDSDIVNCKVFNSQKFNFLNNNNNNNNSNEEFKIERDSDDLICLCLRKNDSERLKLNQILEHKWFKQ
jgi:proto-oncogene serine/threonine-protein kinase Pim-3